MLKTTASTEPKPVRQYFDKRGWKNEPRGHAEILQVYHPDEGWRVHIGRKRISYTWLLEAEEWGITSVTLRVRYSDRRMVTADFDVKRLLKGKQ